MKGTTVTRAKGLRVRPERVKRARLAAGYTQQGLADAMAKQLPFSKKQLVGIEKGTRDFWHSEMQVFMELTNSTEEFLTGRSDTIFVKGLQRDLVDVSYNQLPLPLLVA